MTTRIFLLRHGATALNRQTPYRLQGRRSDPELDDLGIDQARRAAAALQPIRLDAVYSSPLRRAMSTAQLIARTKGLEPLAEQDLIEAEIGHWEGLTWEEAQARDPAHYKLFHERPGTTPYPGGESFADVAHRATAALRILAARHRNESIAVVAHNVVNRAVLAPLLGLSIEKARSLRQSNGGINVLEALDDELKVICMNACLHLE